MKTMTTLIVCAAALLGACGGSNPGLKHQVPDKAVAGLTGDAAVRIETSRGEVAKAQDAFTSGDFEVKTQAQDVSAIGEKSESAADAVDAAAKTIEATDDKRETELRQAASKRDSAIAEAKKRYSDETASIRDRYAKLQTANRGTLTDAKRTQEVVAAQKEVEKAELAEAKARSAVKKQEVTVAKARFEVVKLQALQESTGVVGPKETADKAAFDAQLAAEEKKLADAQAVLDAKTKATEAARTKLEGAKARASGGTK